MKGSESPAPEHPHPIRAVAVVTLLVGLGLAAAYAVSERVDPVFGDQRRQYRRVVASGPAVAAVSLGNSHSRAIDFGALGMEGHRLTSPGSDYYEILRVFRSVRPHLPNLGYLFVTVSPFVVDNSAFSDRLEHRAEIYATTGTYRPMTGDWTAAFNALIRPVVRTDDWEGVAYALVRRPQRGADAPHADVVATAAEVGRYAPTRAAHHRALEEGSLAARPTLCADARAALGEIAEAAAPAHVVFYTAPLTPAYRRHQQTRGCGLDAFAAALAARRPNVSYFDDRALSGFSDGSGLFRDADHLNREGARLYSGLLRERLGAEAADDAAAPTAAARTTTDR